MRNIRIILPAIIVGLIFGILLTANFDMVKKPAAEAISKPLPEISTLFADVAEKTMPSVVTITSAKVYEIPVRTWGPFWNDPMFEFFFGPQTPRQYEKRQYRQEGLGSGVIVSEDGYIITNAHVVNGADEIQVHIGDDKYDAEIVGVDEKTDVAILKVDAEEKLTPAKLGDSDKLRIGEWVLAIGSPFQLEHTVTAGIISAKGRSRMGIADYEDFIQTDAAINPGNSGGAMVDLNGEVIGINTAIVSGTGGNIGIGFAIPINLARQVMDQLITHGKVVRGWLGISIQQVTDELAKGLGLESAQGILVGSVVPESPAEKAGIMRGDVILSVDDKEVESIEQFRNYIASSPPGKKVKLLIVQDGKRRTVNVELGEMPGEKELATGKGKDRKIDLGISMKALGYYDAKRFGLDGGGVLVTDVEEGSIADRAGIRTNDVIMEVNRIPVETPSDVERAISRCKRGDTIVFLVWRDGYTMYLASTIK